MSATMLILPKPSNTTTIELTLPAAQRSNNFSARTYCISQLPTKRPTIKKPKAMVKMTLAVRSVIYPSPVIKLMK